jgi:hypothetical protein
MLSSISSLNFVFNRKLQDMGCKPDRIANLLDG